MAASRPDGTRNRPLRDRWTTRSETPPSRECRSARCRKPRSEATPSVRVRTDLSGLVNPFRALSDRIDFFARNLGKVGLRFRGCHRGDKRRVWPIGGVTTAGNPTPRAPVSMFGARG
jgi:hypothetical protein